MGFNDVLSKMSEFIPLLHCSSWTPELIELHMLLDGLTALASFSMLPPLSRLVRHEPEQPFLRMIPLVIGLSIVCGITHMTGIWTLGQPIGWVVIGLEFITAVLSVAIASQLPSVLSQISALPGSADPVGTTGEVLHQGRSQDCFPMPFFPDLLLRIRQDGTIVELQNGRDVKTIELGQQSVGRKLCEVLPAELAQLYATYVQRALQTRELQVHEYQLSMSNGGEFEEVRCVPCEGNEVLAVVRNITQRKQNDLERELQSIIVSNMAQGACIVRVSDGIIIYVNPKFEQIFGYNTGELKSKHVSSLCYDGNNRQLDYVTFQEVIERGGLVYEVLSVRKNGTPFWCQAAMSGFEHPDYCTMLIVVQQDITERKQAAEVLQSSLAEKDATLEVLLQEVHHRVKNNLGVIDGLLQMQARRSPDLEVTAALSESRNRITSIALIHEKLYRSKDLARINFAHYIRDLTSHLFAFYRVDSNYITLRIEVDNINLDIDRAVPCGLIINELISNALKYAFDKFHEGEIYVSFLRCSNKSYSLTVQDNGIGLPKDLNLDKPKTLGISLIKGLVRQLRGSLDISNELGTKFVITFTEG